MNPSDVPPPLPKITLPAWAYIALIVFAQPVLVAWLTNADVKATLISSVVTGGALVGYRQTVTAPKVQAVALEHRQVNLAIGYAQGRLDAKPAAVGAGYTAKKAAPRKPPAPRKAR